MKAHRGQRAIGAVAALLVIAAVFWVILEQALPPTFDVNDAALETPSADFAVPEQDGAAPVLAGDVAENPPLRSAREELRPSHWLTVTALDHLGQPQSGCDVLVCRSGQPASWRPERCDSIAYQGAGDGPIYTLPGNLLSSPQPIGAALVVGLTDERGVCQLEIPEQCAWATVWCRPESHWMGRLWRAGVHELRFLAEPTCEIAGSLVARDGMAVRLPNGATLVSQDPNTGQLHAGCIDETGAFSCARRATAPALVRLLDAGDWDLVSPVPLMECGAGARLIVERVERVTLVDAAGAALQAAELFVLEQSAHGVLSRRSSAAAGGVHRVWPPDTRVELVARPSLLLIRAEGFASRTLVRPFGHGPCALLPGRDPRLLIVGEANDSLRIDLGGDGTPVSPQTCLVAEQVPASGRLECEVPAGVIVRVLMSRGGRTVLQREIATAQDTIVAADDSTTGRLAVYAEGDWAEEVIAEAVSRSRNGCKADGGVWLFADLAPGLVHVSAVPKAGRFDWRDELGMRRGITCEVLAGAETRVDLPQPAALLSHIVAVDAHGRLLPNVTIRDREKATRVTGPVGEIEQWTEWKPPLALAEVPPGVWLPIPIRGEPAGSGEVVVATVETRWLDALSPVEVRVFTGDIEGVWKSITFTSAERAGRLVMFAQGDAPGVSSWPMDLDGKLNVEIALRGGGIVRAESVVVAGGRYELRAGAGVAGDWCRLRLWVRPRSDGMLETVNVVIFDASNRVLQAGDHECLAVRTGHWTEVLTRPGPKRVVARARNDDEKAEWTGDVEGNQMAVRLAW